MPLIRKLLGLWVLGKTMSSTSTLFNRLLASMVAIAILTICVSVLILLLTGGLLCFAYVELTLHGLEPQAAVILLTGVVVLFLISILLYVRYHFRRVSNITRNFVHTQSTINFPLQHLTDAFMDGLMSGPSPL